MQQLALKRLFSTFYHKKRSVLLFLFFTIVIFSSEIYSQTTNTESYASYGDITAPYLTFSSETSPFNFGFGGSESTFVLQYGDCEEVLNFNQFGATGRTIEATISTEIITSNFSNPDSTPNNGGHVLE